MDSPAPRPEAAADVADAAVSPPDERAASSRPGRTNRRAVSLDAHLLRGSGEIANVELNDLSYDGCKIRTPVYLWQGEPLKLSVPRRGVIEAVVRWCTDGSAGLVFAPEPKPARAQTPRAEKRIKARGEVVLRRLGLPGFKVDIHDLSRVGCKIELIERPRIDELVTIKFEGLEPLEARIKWVEGFVAGALFDRSIHPAVFDLLRLRLGA